MSIERLIIAYGALAIAIIAISKVVHWCYIQISTVMKLVNMVADNFKGTDGRPGMPERVASMENDVKEIKEILKEKE